MSKKIAIVSDSSASLTDETLKEYDIYTSYLMVVFGDDYYQEFKELTPEKFVALSKTQTELPTTSQAAIGTTVELYEDLIKKGYDEIVHITISSGLSGSYQSATTAANMVDEENIYVFDSKTVAFPQGGLAIAAAKLAKDGHDAATIIAALEEVRKTTFVKATVKTLENLKKGGRLSNASAALGGMLQIKPIITMSEEGKLEAVAKVRTFNKAIQALLEAAQEAKLDDTYEMAIIHVLNEEDAKGLKEAVAQTYPNLTIHILPLSLVVSAHVGEGTLAVTWVKMG